LLAVRTHVDVCDDRLLAVDALLHVKKRVAPYLDMQRWRFRKTACCAPPRAMDNLKRALERAWTWSRHSAFRAQHGRRHRSVRLPCRAGGRAAAARGPALCRRDDDPLSRHIEYAGFHTQRLGLHGRVAGSHLTSMHSMDNYYVSKLIR